MSKSKSRQLSREEFIAIVRTELTALENGARHIRGLIESVSKSSDANFVTIDDATKCLTDFDGVKSSAKTVRDAIIVRLRTRTNEHKLVSAPIKKIAIK